VLLYDFPPEQMHGKERTGRVGGIAEDNQALFYLINDIPYLTTSPTFFLAMTLGINRLTSQPVIEFVYKRFRQGDHK